MADDKKDNQNAKQQDTSFNQEMNQRMSEIRQQKITTYSNKDDSSQTMLLSSGFNFENRENQEKQHGIVGWIRNKLKPIAIFFHNAKRKLEDSSRRRRRLFVGSLLGTMFFTLALGMIFKLPPLISNTAIGSSHTFLNGDSIKITNEQFDSSTKTARIDITTTSPAGALSSNDLSAKFVVAEPPKTKVTAPTIQLIPTFNNHYVAIIRNVYPGFKGIMVQFKNTNLVSVSEVSKTLTDDGSPIGATKLNDKQIKLIQKVSNTSDSITTTNNSKDAKEVESIIKYIHSNNTQSLIFSEKSLTSKKSQLNSNASPSEIALNDLHDRIKKQQSVVEGNKKLIEQTNKTINQVTARIQQIHQNASYNNDNESLQQASNQLNELKANNKNYQSQINNAKQEIQQNQYRIEQITSRTVSFDKPAKPSSALVYQGN